MSRVGGGKAGENRRRNVRSIALATAASAWGTVQAFVSLQKQKLMLFEDATRLARGQE